MAGNGKIIIFHSGVHEPYMLSSHISRKNHPIEGIPLVQAKDLE